jgi:hypothetical protein
MKILSVLFVFCGRNFQRLYRVISWCVVVPLLKVKRE